MTANLSDMKREPSPTQRAIRQAKPFRSLGQEAVVALLLAAERIRWPYLDLLAAEGDLTLQQYNVLRILRGAGASGLPTLDIAARMIDKSPGITRLLDRLEARRLVRRVRCPQDRRQVLCHATAQARQLLAELDAPMAEAARRLVAPLGGSRTLALIASLDEIRNAATSATPQPRLPETTVQS